MLGDILKDLRSDRDITQKDLSKIISISPQTYSKYEQNKRQPGYDILIKLADFYGVSLDYLLGRSKYENTEKYINRFKGYPQNVVNIIEGICSLSKEKDISKKMAIFKKVLNELTKLL